MIEKWEFMEIAESAWLGSWEIMGSPIFPGDFKEFVAQKNRFLSEFERRLTKTLMLAIGLEPPIERNPDG